MEQRLISVDLRDKNALVTGSAQGIGAAIAKTLAANGANVAVNYYSNMDKAQVLAEEFKAGGVDAVAIQADVSRLDDVERLIREAQEAFGGPIDILVNNAGSQIKQSTIEEMPIELWEKVLGLNLTGAMVCAKCVIPGMKRSRWGRIINIASISARSGGGPGGSHYAASKAGMVSLTKSLAKELGPYNITANAIAPGVIMTEIHEKFSTKESLEQLKGSTVLGHLGQAEDIAGTALFLASDSASYITGETIAINGGLRMD